MHKRSRVAPNAKTENPERQAMTAMRPVLLFFFLLAPNTRRVHASLNRTFLSHARVLLFSKERKAEYTNEFLRISAKTG